jgi:hypothetical protein
MSDKTPDTFSPENAAQRALASARDGAQAAAVSPAVRALCGFLEAQCGLSPIERARAIGG